MRLGAFGCMAKNQWYCLDASSSLFRTKFEEKYTNICKFIKLNIYTSIG